MAVRLKELAKYGKADASKCSGWSPTSGKYQGEGAKCEKYQWDMKWCYVDSSLSTEHYVEPSGAYQGQYFAPCETKEDEKKQCLYPMNPNGMCLSWCSTHPATSGNGGVDGCRYTQCDTCDPCCHACRDRYEHNCPAWIGAYGCEAVLNINGEVGPLNTHCKKTCGTCGA